MLGKYTFLKLVLIVLLLNQSVCTAIFHLNGNNRAKNMQTTIKHKLNSITRLTANYKVEASMPEQPKILNNFPKTWNKYKKQLAEDNSITNSKVIWCTNANSRTQCFYARSGFIYQYGCTPTNGCVFIQKHEAPL